LFFDKVILHKARVCRTVRDKDIYAMVRWALYADKSWQNKGLRSHMSKATKSDQQPSRRLLTAFVHNVFISLSDLDKAVGVLTQQLPNLQVSALELFLLYEQRRTFVSHFEIFVAPLVSACDWPLKAIVKKVIVSEKKAGESLQYCLIRAAHEVDRNADTRSDETDHKTAAVSATQWLLELLLSVTRSESEVDELTKQVIEAAKHCNETDSEFTDIVSPSTSSHRELDPSVIFRNNEE